MDSLIQEGLSAPITGGGPERMGRGANLTFRVAMLAEVGTRLPKGEWCALAFVAVGQAPKEAATGRLL